MRSLILSLLAACAVLAGCAATPPSETGTADAAEPCASGQCPLPATADPQDAVIHAALMRHPEWLMEVGQALQARQRVAMEAQARRAITANHAAIYDAGDPTTGNPQGEVTVVEFYDYECPYCKRLAPDIERLIAADKGVRVVYKDYPILGPGSVAAARAALAAQKQGRYEAFHNALMADKTPEHQLAEPRVMQIAKSVGLDVVRLKRDMEASDIGAKLAANAALARQLGITGTPGLIIGDRLAPGALPYPALVQAVADARASGNTAHRNW